MNKAIISKFFIQAQITKVSLFLLFAFISIHNISAQEQEEVVLEHMKYFKDHYEETYKADFNKVWQATKKFIENEGCRILSEKETTNDLEKPRGIVRSELCVMTQTADSSFQFIQKYAIKPPFIRGGVWASARVQYRFIVNDKGDGNVSVVVKVDFSGWESNVTGKPYDFTSSGLLEFTAFEKITALVNNG